MTSDTSRGLVWKIPRSSICGAVDPRSNRGVSGRAAVEETVATERTIVWRRRRANWLGAGQAYRLAAFDPDVRSETVDLQSHIRLVESGNTVGLLRDLVWIGQRATARQVAGSAGGDTVGD